MSEVLQGALDPAVAPRGILPRHPDRQMADLAQHTGASHASSLNGPFARDELPVPPHDRIRGHQGGHLRQDPSAQTVTGGRESAALDVGQPQAPPTNVFVEDAVLFPQVRNDLKLVAIHPASERHEQDPQPDGVDHGPSLSAPASTLPGWALGWIFG